MLKLSSPESEKIVKKTSLSILTTEEASKLNNSGDYWWRGVSKEEAEYIAKNNKFKNHSDVPIFQDPEVTEFLGMSEEESDQLEKEYKGKKIVNVTEDIENARGYGDYIIAVPRNEVDEFDVYGIVPMDVEIVGVFHSYDKDAQFKEALKEFPSFKKEVTTNLKNNRVIVKKAFQTTKVVWMKANKEDKLGNKQIIRKPTLEDFVKEILPRTMEGNYKGETDKEKYKDMFRKFPDMAISYINRGGGWEAIKIDDYQEIMANVEYGKDMGWAMEVSDFDSPEALKHRKIWDEDIPKKAQGGYNEHSTRNGKVNLDISKVDLEAHNVCKKVEKKSALQNIRKFIVNIFKASGGEYKEVATVPPGRTLPRLKDELYTLMELVTNQKEFNINDRIVFTKDTLGELPNNEEILIKPGTMGTIINKKEN